MHPYTRLTASWTGRSTFRGIALQANMLRLRLHASRVDTKSKLPSIGTQNTFRDLPIDISMILLRVSTQRLAPVDGCLAQYATDLFSLQGIGRFWHVSRASNLAFLRFRLYAMNIENLNCQLTRHMTTTMLILLLLQLSETDQPKQNIEFQRPHLVPRLCHAMFSLLN